MAVIMAGCAAWKAGPSTTMASQRRSISVGLSGTSCAPARLTVRQPRRSSRCVRRGQSSFSVTPQAAEKREGGGMELFCGGSVR